MRYKVVQLYIFIFSHHSHAVILLCVAEACLYLSQHICTIQMRTVQFVTNLTDMDSTVHGGFQREALTKDGENW